MTGFDSKRDMAAEKLQEDQVKYGTAWSQDGKRIDPMSVYKEQPAQEPAQEPPSEWAGIKAILDEYGLQAIDFVADFKAALAQPAQKPVQEPPSAYESLVRDMMTIAAREVPRGLPYAEFAMHALADAERRSRTTPPLPAQEPAFGWINSSELAQARLHGGSVNMWLEKYDCDFPVYTAPPQRPWVGLTEGEREEIVSGYTIGPGFELEAVGDVGSVARAVEDKLKERNYGT